MRKRVKVLKVLCGPDFNYAPGQEATFAGAVADALEQAGAVKVLEVIQDASAVVAPPERAVEVEAAVEEPAPEKAVKVKRGRRDRFAEDYQE